jgi:hypothetical protein
MHTEDAARSEVIDELSSEPVTMHWTYAPVQATADLQQGDILLPSSELGAVLAVAHPYFCDPKYLGFLVLTQTCDMERRDGAPCSAQYIALAPIRELEYVVPSLLARACDSVAPNVFTKASKLAASQLLRRVFNQNEPLLGLFYLHPDLDAVGIGVPAVATLRVSFAMWASHYDVLTNARRGRLAPSFEAKLGWMIGHIYSRVGVTDWHEAEEREADLKARRRLSRRMRTARSGSRAAW